MNNTHGYLICVLTMLLGVLCFVVADGMEDAKERGVKFQNQDGFVTGKLVCKASKDSNWVYAFNYKGQEYLISRGHMIRVIK